MRRFAMPLLLLLAGCEHADQERLHQYADVGVQAYASGDYAAAQLSFQAALTMRSDDPNLLYNLGRCYEQQHDHVRAEDSYEACLKQDANHAECRHALARLWWNTGKRDRASEMIQKWLTEQPRLAAAYAHEGWRLHQENDLPSAQARLQQALRLEPRNSLALVELAAVYEKMELPDRSLVLYQRVLEQEPSRHDVIDRINALKAQGVGPPLPD
jgi:tetratricopeptide (TPR) repeat protein